MPYYNLSSVKYLHPVSPTPLPNNTTFFWVPVKMVLCFGYVVEFLMMLFEKYGILEEQV